MVVSSSTFSQFNPRINTDYPQIPAYLKTQTKSYPSDSFDLSTKNEKSSTKGWLLAGGAIAALGIGALILRGRMKSVTKLAEHIDFKPAKTIDEARCIHCYEINNEFHSIKGTNESIKKQEFIMN